jgi:hypothetical protein
VQFFRGLLLFLAVNVVFQLLLAVDVLSVVLSFILVLDLGFLLLPLVSQIVHDAPTGRLVVGES